MRSDKITLVVTNKCNLHCIYCYEENKSNTMMSLQTAKECIMDTIQDSDNEYVDVTFFGGEPFLAFDIIKSVCEWCWSLDVGKKFLFSVITNGCAFTEESKKWLSENNKKINVVLSLDGTPKTQNINRSNSFDNVDIQFYKEQWPDMGVKMTVSNESLSNLCEDIKYVHSLGLNIFECNLAFGIDWSDKNNKNIFKRQMEDLFLFYRDNKELIPAEIINIDVGGCENERKLLKTCGAGESKYVDSDGRIFPCNYINPSCFPEKDLNFLTGLDFDNLEELEDMDCYKNCYIYYLCPTCYAANYKVNGKVNVRDKALCEINKIRAFYAALLWADRIKQDRIEVLSVYEKGVWHKRITAIKRIISEYGDLVERQ